MKAVKNGAFCSHLTHQVYLFIAFKDLLVLLDLERSQKVDLGRCRFLGPIRSLRLEGKGFQRGVNDHLLMGNSCEKTHSQLIRLNQVPVVGHGEGTS